MLTVTTIRNAKPKEKLYRLADSNGLCLEVTPNASKLWRFRYRYAGKAKMISLGSFPSTSLADARKKRDEAQEILASGIDPSTHRRAAKRQETQFSSLAEDWFERSSPLWATSTRDKARLYLDKDILPFLGSSPLSSITRPDLVALIRRVEARGALNVSQKIRQWLHQIFRFGLASGLVVVNIATDLDIVAAPQKPTQHHPSIPFEELPELIYKVENARIHFLTRSAIRLLILTAVRPGELRMAPWEEFDLENSTWLIPKERMKAREPHAVPLPTQAIELLKQLQSVSGKFSFVFPGQNNPARPMSENTINKALAQLGYKGRQTGHGFRHMLSTELNTREYKSDWIESQLAHADSNEIRGTYNHATYLDQRRVMMQEWADSIDAMLKDYKFKLTNQLTPF